jgi:hypothetical protein
LTLFDIVEIQINHQSIVFDRNCSMDQWWIMNHFLQFVWVKWQQCLSCQNPELMRIIFIQSIWIDFQAKLNDINVWIHVEILPFSDSYSIDTRIWWRNEGIEFISTTIMINQWSSILWTNAISVASMIININENWQNSVKFASLSWKSHIPSSFTQSVKPTIHRNADLEIWSPWTRMKLWFNNCSDWIYWLIIINLIPKFENRILFSIFQTKWITNQITNLMGLMLLMNLWWDNFCLYPQSSLVLDQDEHCDFKIARQWFNCENENCDHLDSEIVLHYSLRMIIKSEYWPFSLHSISH